MKNIPDFIRRSQRNSEKWRKIGVVKDIVFSEGTYQVCIYDRTKHSTFWPFLHIDDEGNVIDAFCSCEELKECAHLPIAYFEICKEKEPLHVRFRSSFWNHLFQTIAKRIGYRPTFSSFPEKDGYFSQEEEPLFSIKAFSANAKKRLREIVSQKKEESSLKFSRLSLDEIVRWKEGKASASLLYELSFWSDLAKWAFFLQNQNYTIQFLKNPPDRILITFPVLKIEVKIDREQLVDIIPFLPSVISPFQVHYPEEDIEKIVYDQNHFSLNVLMRKEKILSEEERSKGMMVNDWLYVPKKGFYSCKKIRLLQKEIFSRKEIGSLLTDYGAIIQKYLQDLEVKLDPISPSYHLFFDRDLRFHIECYVFDIGDLHKNYSCSFGIWFYVEGKGFYRFKDPLFEGIEKIIEKKNISEFINAHRSWLQQFKGFGIHSGSFVFQLSYRVDRDLEFFSKLELKELQEEVKDLGEWVYIQGKGFYPKKPAAAFFVLRPGLIIPRQEIGSFISQHREELEEIEGFFLSTSPIEKLGISLDLDENNRLRIKPELLPTKNVRKSDCTLFDSYIYVKDRGFYEIPLTLRLPEKYTKEYIVPQKDWNYFFSFEYEQLCPRFLTVDRRLQKPKEMQVHIRGVHRERAKQRYVYYVDLLYLSELGSVHVIDIWHALRENRRYLFSQAGLLFLREARWQWLRRLSPERIDAKRKRIHLNMIEWLRLSVYETLVEPKEHTTEAETAKSFLRQLFSYRSKIPFDLSLLRANLWPYQIIGFEWLWFLYVHQLSGILCDEMGLGKTLQAMALLAAAGQEDRERNNRYLVICPTSVIYHWQELFKTFLPSFRILTYHGIKRTIVPFAKQYDVLLTSYGIIRGDVSILQQYEYEIAIFDEIQIAKNYLSKTYRSLKGLDAKMKLGLTGTPIENRLRELKALLDLVLPGYLPSDALFREHFIRPIEKENDTEKKVLLQKLVKPFLLRRKKAEVLPDLPEKIEEIAYCDLSQEQQDLYRETLEQRYSEVLSELQDEKKPVPYLHVFALLTKLKQICNHPSMIYKDLDRFYQHHCGKWDLFVELLNEAQESDQKVVIFSQYLDMLAIIETYLKNKEIPFASIKGATRERAKEITRFHCDPQCRVFVASLLAAGLGIDLSCASVVIHYDRWWNPAKEEQATDRVHRIGQNRGVQVFKLVTKDSVEEHIHRIIEKKKGLIEEIVGKEKGDEIKFLNREELVILLEHLKSDIEI